MNAHRGMSPFTALFIGIFGVGAVTITGASCIVLYGMRIAEQSVGNVLGLADRAIEGLPELINSLPPALGDLLDDRRAPEYAAHLNVDVKFTADERGRVRPVMTVTNNGDHVVSMLAVRVAALGRDGAPEREWTEVVATPIAIEDEWRGPLMPRSTRHVVVSGSCGRTLSSADDVTPVHEISEIRVWEPKGS